MRPLDVIPLCRPCHGSVHAGVLVEPRTGRLYPRRGGNIPGSPRSPLGRRLSTARAVRGWSWAELARQLGVSPQVVEGWASDLHPRTPDAGDLVRLAFVLCEDLGELTTLAARVEVPDAERAAAWLAAEEVVNNA